MNLFKELSLLQGNTKGKVFLTCFRISSFFSKSLFFKIIGFPFRVFYSIMFQWILGIDIYDTTVIGAGFNVYHGMGIVINRDVIIGNGVVIRHNTTIGNARKGGKCPVIGNNVNVGAHSIIIGDITVGDNAVIAGGAVVIKTVPKGAVVAGNPARVIKQNIV